MELEQIEITPLCQDLMVIAEQVEIMNRIRARNQDRMQMAFDRDSKRKNSYDEFTLIWTYNRYEQEICNEMPFSAKVIHR